MEDGMTLDMINDRLKPTALRFVPKAGLNKEF